MSNIPDAKSSSGCFRQLVNARKDRIQAYRYYKHLFEVGDKFNRALLDRQWPHSRGGKSTQGDQGARSPRLPYGCYHVKRILCLILSA